jgi:hypothetical protein
MLATETEVVRALTRYRDIFDPRSGSVIVAGRSQGCRSERDPFRGGFIGGIEERGELVRRLSLLDPRSRRVLCLWYIAALPVTHIARRVGLSRMHCYRLRNRALRRMIEDPSADPAEATA